MVCAMDHIPMGCGGKGPDIAEVNIEQVSELILPSALKEGDVVNVCQHVKGGVT